MESHEVSMSVATVITNSNNQNNTIAVDLIGMNVAQIDDHIFEEEVEILQVTEIAETS